MEFLSMTLVDQCHDIGPDFYIDVHARRVIDAGAPGGA
jgi:hypothetical protein